MIQIFQNLTYYLFFCILIPNSKMDDDKLDILIKKLEQINTELDELVYLSADIKTYAANIDKL